MKVKTILVSQPEPKVENSPYFELEEKEKVKIDFIPFIHVEGVDAKDVRQQKVDLSQFTAIILTSRNSVDHFFRIAEEMRYKVPDSLKYLVKDWFKEVTLYDNRLKDANYKMLDNGKYKVTLEIESSKIKSDSLGNETKTAINDWIDVGFFMDDDEKELYQQKRMKFNKEKSSITVQLDKLPVKAAIDPRHLLIDRVYDDNIKRISLQE